jgi:Zn finger protein HypA/HybF involved in hydrogenase expression
MAVSMDEIEEAIEEYRGWCTVCQDFTSDGVEPDAEKYECEECGQRTVYGAENAVLMGAFG